MAEKLEPENLFHFQTLNNYNVFLYINLYLEYFKTYLNEPESNVTRSAIKTVFQQICKTQNV